MTEQRKIDEEDLSKLKEVYHKAGYEQGYAKAVIMFASGWNAILISIIGLTGLKKNGEMMYIN